MSGFLACGRHWLVAIELALFLGLTAGSVHAGPEEDYAAGMIHYRRMDFVPAMPLLRKAADAGHVEAQVVLASILDAAEFDEEAVSYYRKAAATGNLDAVFGLGLMIVAGDGVKPDVAEGAALIRRAAEAGHKTAISVLAQAYIRGDLGIPEENRKGQEALKWISLAADQGVLLAQEAMEKAYRTGEFGLGIDVQKADAIKKRLLEQAGVQEKKGRRRGGAKE
jgi:TPR repeat protein